MSRLTWDSIGERFFEGGVDRGVLYVPGQGGVVWNGLTGVTEKPSGGTATPYYIDGVKYLNVSSFEEFVATITAFTYPDEFMACDGTAEIDTGLYVLHQPRKQFSFVYRTKIGNDVSGADLGYKVHLVYNAMAQPSQRVDKSFADSTQPVDFSWDITLQPPAIAGFRSSGHLILDSQTIYPGALAQIEDILYGTDSTDPRIPDIPELSTIIATNAFISVVDNGDGTWTLTTDDYAFHVNSDGTFVLISDSVTDNGDGTFTIITA